MKNFVLYIFLILFTSKAFAFDFSCSEITGLLSVVPDTECEVVHSPLRDYAFPTSRFVAETGVPNEEACFTGNLQFEADGKNYIGHAMIGQTINSFPAIPATPQMFSASDIVKIRNEHGKRKGSLFLKHFALIDFSVFQFDEEVAIVGGTGRYRGARGQLQISGNLFTGAEVSGSVCTIF